jgi:hypothetical protein
MNWPDGIVYEGKTICIIIIQGEFEDAVQCGTGKIQYPDESFYDGEWEEGVKAGIGS